MGRRGGETLEVLRRVARRSLKSQSLKRRRTLETRDLRLDANSHRRPRRSSGNRTGIGVHTAEIARRLDVDPPPLIASHAEIADRAGLERCAFRVDRIVARRAVAAAHAAAIDADVLWGPHGTLPLAWKQPAVVTLHDFTSITMPRRHRLKTILSFNLFIGASLEQASRVACVSRAVADEAMRGFGVARVEDRDRAERRR